MGSLLNKPIFALSPFLSSMRECALCILKIEARNVKCVMEWAPL